MIPLKDKRGFFGLFSLIGIGMILILLIIVLIFWNKLELIWLFIKQWWWAMSLFIFTILWHRQIKAVVNAILRKFGVKI